MSGEASAARARLTPLAAAMSPAASMIAWSLMTGFLWRIDPRSDWRARAGRLLDLLIEGLRSGAPVGPDAAD
jgi:hypothetical protein